LKYNGSNIGFSALYEAMECHRVVALAENRGESICSAALFAAPTVQGKSRLPKLDKTRYGNSDFKRIFPFKRRILLFGGKIGSSGTARKA
jgi:hypothetical protein